MEHQSVKIWIIVVVALVIVLVVTLAVVLPSTSKQHFEAHPALALSRQAVAHQGNVGLPDFQPYGTVLLNEETHVKFNPLFAFNQEHRVGLVLAQTVADLNTWDLMTLRGIDSRGEVVLHPFFESLKASIILQVEIHGAAGHPVRACVVSIPSQSSSEIHINLLGYTTSFHWHVYKTWVVTATTQSTQKHRATFTKLDSGLALAFLDNQTLHTYRIQDLEQGEKPSRRSHGFPSKPICLENLSRLQEVTNV